jgi:hypothetical protein
MVANKQIIGPMRQAWINRLREMIAELCAEVVVYGTFPKGSLNITESIKKIFLLHQEIKLTINPGEQSHKELESAISDMISALTEDPVSQDKLTKSRPKVQQLTQQILKTEWNRVKADIEEPPPLNYSIRWKVIVALVLLVLATGFYICYRQVLRPKRVFLTRHQTFQLQSGLKGKDDIEEDDSLSAEQRLSSMMTESPRCIVLTQNKQKADFIVKISVSRFPTDFLGDFATADLSIAKRNGDVILVDAFEQNLKSAEDIAQSPLNRTWEVLCGKHHP